MVVKEVEEKVKEDEEAVMVMEAKEEEVMEEMHLHLHN